MSASRLTPLQSDYLRFSARFWYRTSLVEKVRLYLERIGFSPQKFENSQEIREFFAKPQNPLDCLSQFIPLFLSSLNRHHVHSIPFETYSMHRGKSILLQRPYMFMKIILQRQGGFCFELNNLFGWLLEVLPLLSPQEIGFSSSFPFSSSLWASLQWTIRYAGACVNTTYTTDEQGEYSNFTHIAIVLTLQEKAPGNSPSAAFPRRLLIDVGFGQNPKDIFSYNTENMKIGNSSSSYTGLNDYYRRQYHPDGLIYRLVPGVSSAPGDGEDKWDFLQKFLPRPRIWMNLYRFQPQAACLVNPPLEEETIDHYHFSSSFLPSGYFPNLQEVIGNYHRLQAAPLLGILISEKNPLFLEENPFFSGPEGEEEKQKFLTLLGKQCRIREEKNLSLNDEAFITDNQPILEDPTIFFSMIGLKAFLTLRGPDEKFLTKEFSSLEERNSIIEKVYGFYPHSEKLKPNAHMYDFLTVENTWPLKEGGAGFQPYSPQRVAEEHAEFDAILASEKAAAIAAAK